MKATEERPTPQNTTKGFGTYSPWNEPEMQHNFALDVLTVLSGFLESAGSASRRDLMREEIFSAGVLLDAAREVLAWQGLPGEKDQKERKIQIAQRLELMAKRSAAGGKRR